MKSVMLSIKHKYCELIANGKKTIEVRKTRPKIETPFKCYIYECMGKKLYNDYFDYEGCGKVIGEFVCDAIFPMSIEYSDPESRVALKHFPFTCLTDKQIMDYLGNGKQGYGWHISDLVIYDEPKELREFINKSSQFTFGEDGVFVYKGMTRPPQSWCYVEGGNLKDE